MSDELNATSVQTEAAVANEESSQENTTVLTDTTSTPDAEQAKGNEGTSEETLGGEAADGSQTESQESYADFSLPEGVTLDETILGSATDLFKESGLNQEQAQKFIDLHSDLVQAGATGQVEAFNQTVNEWRELSASDKEFGGDAFEENVGVARSAIEKFGTPELSKLLEDYGVGNHPEVVRFMVRVGKLTREDVPGSGSPSTPEKDRLSILYPKKSA